MSHKSTSCEHFMLLLFSIDLKLLPNSTLQNDCWQDLFKKALLKHRLLLAQHLPIWQPLSQPCLGTHQITSQP